MAEYKWNKNRLMSLVMVLLGNLLYAFTVKLFLLPASLISCGTNGIAFVVNHLTGIPLTGFIFVFNILVILFNIPLHNFAFYVHYKYILYPFCLFSHFIESSIKKLPPQNSLFCSESYLYN